MHIGQQFTRQHFDQYSLQLNTFHVVLFNNRSKIVFICEKTDLNYNCNVILINANNNCSK